MRPSLPLTCLSALALGAFAPIAHAQTTLLNQTFDGYTAGANIPSGTGQTFQSPTGAFPVSNTNAATLFPSAVSTTSVAGGDAGTNYVTFGAGAAFVARTNTITGFNTPGLYSVVYDTNLPTTGSGGVSLSLVTSTADTNGTAGTFVGFTLASTGGVSSLIIAANGGSLTGGSATVPLGLQFALTILVNSSATAATYSNGTATVTLAAFTADLYSSSLNTSLNYIGRLTSFTGTNATTNQPQQLGFRTFNNNTFGARFNELNVVTGLNIATVVPEPSTYAAVALGTMLLTVALRRRMA